MSAAEARAVTAIGWLRIGARLLTMLLHLLACLVLYYLWRAPALVQLQPHNPWPRRFLGGIARIAGVTVRTSGTRVPSGAFLIANHVSWIDIPAIGGVSGAAFVAHDRLAAVPVLRWLCAMNGTVFIARHDRASVARQVAQLREAIRETGALAIFPEGTTGDGASLLPFKSSLLSAIDPVPEGIAVQPVLLDYGSEAPAIAWAGEESGFDNCMRILARARKVELTVHFLSPLADAALANRKTMAAAAREALLAELVRVSETELP